MGSRVRKSLTVIDWVKLMSDAVEHDREYQKRNSAIVSYVS